MDKIASAPQIVGAGNRRRPRFTSTQRIQTPLRHLIEDNIVEFTGVFTSESLILNRLVRPAEFAATIRWHDRRPPANEPDWYYVRVTQHNGHVAWSSPVWIG